MLADITEVSLPSALEAMIETLADLLGRVLRQHYGGKKSAMAKAIEMTPSPLGKAIDGSSRYFGTEACLRLARVTGEPASRILQIAGKADLAALIESLYGQQTVAPTDRELLNDWKAIPANERDNLRRVVRDAAARSRRPGTRKRDERESSEDAALKKRGRSTSSAR